MNKCFGLKFLFLVIVAFPVVAMNQGNKQFPKLLSDIKKASQFKGTQEIAFGHSLCKQPSTPYLPPILITCSNNRQLSIRATPENEKRIEYIRKNSITFQNAQKDTGSNGNKFDFSLLPIEEIEPLMDIPIDRTEINQLKLKSEDQLFAIARAANFLEILPLLDQTSLALSYKIDQIEQVEMLSDLEEKIKRWSEALPKDIEGRITRLISLSSIGISGLRMQLEKGPLSLSAQMSRDGKKLIANSYDGQGVYNRALVLGNSGKIDYRGIEYYDLDNMRQKYLESLGDNMEAKTSCLALNNDGSLCYAIDKKNNYLEVVDPTKHAIGTCLIKYDIQKKITSNLFINPKGTVAVYAGEVVGENGEKKARIYIDNVLEGKRLEEIDTDAKYPGGRISSVALSDDEKLLFVATPYSIKVIDRKTKLTLKEFTPRDPRGCGRSIDQLAISADNKTIAILQCGYHYGRDYGDMSIWDLETEKCIMHALGYIPSSIHFDKNGTLQGLKMDASGAFFPNLLFHDKIRQLSLSQVQLFLYLSKKKALGTDLKSYPTLEKIYESLPQEMKKGLDTKHSAAQPSSMWGFLHKAAAKVKNTFVGN